MLRWIVVYGRYIKVMGWTSHRTLARWRSIAVLIAQAPWHGGTVTLVTVAGLCGGSYHLWYIPKKSSPAYFPW
jgi:hypothetical protein